MKTDVCNVLMVYPRFTANSFWSLKKTCDLIGRKHLSPPLGLITVAAMLPSAWAVRLVDCNTRDLLDADLEWADLVMTGGMLPQQFDTLRIVDECHAHGKPVAVGGPDVSSSPALYEAADFRVTGEAEGIIEEFIDAWSRGHRSGLFEAPKFQVDVTTSPIPRYDLVNFRDYINIGIQFSRGCPFNCEFCDIIELYGHMPRTKTSDQVLEELQTLYDLGHRGNVDFVDDNFIGNKKAIKALLPQMAEWQKEKGYPFEFSTEASINLSDDPQLLSMMKAAAFTTVFVGIESADPVVLTATQKKQNTRRDIAESVHKIYGAGIYVIAGFIVGFDEEKTSVSDSILQLIEDTAIPFAMVGLLTALPNTQLTRRLQREGRIAANHDIRSAGEDWGDQCTAGLNFETIRPRREILTDYKTIVEQAYTPDAYFKRVRKVCKALNADPPPATISMARIRVNIGQALRLTWGAMRSGPEYRQQFFATVWYCCRHNPWALRTGLKLVALYAHLGDFSKVVTRQIEEQIEEIEADRKSVGGPVPVLESGVAVSGRA